MTELSSFPTTSGAETSGWQSIYFAYEAVCHHDYTGAVRYLMNALREGAGTRVLKASTDLSYLSRGLSSVASRHHEATVTESSCDAQILQALMLSIVDNESNAIDRLKVVALNNQTYPSLKYLKAKINSMEFERLNAQWRVPPDLLRLDGKMGNFSKWKASKFPLKIYIPSDAAAKKIRGYKVGDGRSFRAACEAWQRQSGGLIRFAYEPVPALADITCAWVSSQQELNSATAVGNCTVAVGRDGFLSEAKIRVLTVVDSYMGDVPSGESAQFRERYLEQVCMHEIGHSFGLNHSACDKDVMWTHTQWPPMTTLTSADVSASKSLYQNNLFDFVQAAIDATMNGQNKVAAAAFDKVSSSSRDSQTRTLICIWLTSAAKNALLFDQKAAAISLLERASDLAPSNDGADAKEHVLKELYNAYVHAGKTDEAIDLEKKYAYLQVPGDGAAFLDRFGIRPDSIHHYEEALANSPRSLSQNS
jgi:hypothetical protein